MSNEKSRITLRAIAEKLGVHQSTVSCALRNLPSISPEMRKRAQEVAREMGYERDPMLEALNVHRTLKNPVPAGTAVGFITDSFTVRRGEGGKFGDRILKGAMEAAKDCGLKLERFVLGERDLTPKRVASILWARNIDSVVVACLRTDPEELNLDWREFHATCIEMPRQTLRLETVSSDQWQVGALALRKLYELGYRRLGLVIDDRAEEWMGSRLVGGILLENSLLPPMQPIAIHRYRDAEGIDARPQELAEWVERHQIDAILGCCSYPPKEYERLRAKRGGRLAFAALDLTEGDTSCAGILQGHDLVGRTALENLNSLIRLKRKGEANPNTITFVPGKWVDGPTAPRVAPL